MNNDDTGAIQTDAKRNKRGETDSDAIDVDFERQRSLSEAIEKATLNTVTRVTFDKKRRKTFIELVANGLTISDAARRVGMHATAIHHLRRRDPALDEAITMAVELGCDPVVERLQAIALHGKAESMATVRAAEILLQKHPEYRRSGGSVRMERKDPDGTTYRLSASANGIPD